jgi:hypothetical protein
LVASDASVLEQEQIDEILRKLGVNTCEWFMITQQTIFPAEGRLFGSKQDLISDLSSALTCHHHVLAIFHHGRLIQDHEMAAYKEEALDNLGPISMSRPKQKMIGSSSFQVPALMKKFLGRSLNFWKWREAR